MLKNYLINKLGDLDMKKWEKFSIEEIKEFAKDSRSYAELARKIGYVDPSNNGGAYHAVRQMINSLNLDISHFTGQGWSKGNYDYSKFCYGKKLKSPTALNAIASLRDRKCECCGLTEWNNKPIPLQIHHIDGDNLNNELDNLQLLCPNCHAQTDNYCGKNKEKKNISDEEFVNALCDSDNIHQALIKLDNVQGRLYERAYRLIDEYNIIMPSKFNQDKESNRCCDCGKEIDKSATRCRACSTKRRHIDYINAKPVTRDELKMLIRTTSFRNIGKQFNVSDNTIRKWCKLFNLPSLSRDIKAYSDKEWDFI